MWRLVILVLAAAACSGGGRRSGAGSAVPDHEVPRVDAGALGAVELRAFVRVAVDGTLTVGRLDGGTTAELEALVGEPVLATSVGPTLADLMGSTAIDRRPPCGLILRTVSADLGPSILVVAAAGAPAAVIADVLAVAPAPAALAGRGGGPAVRPLRLVFDGEVSADPGDLTIDDTTRAAHLVAAAAAVLDAGGDDLVVDAGACFTGVDQGVDVDADVGDGDDDPTEEPGPGGGGTGDAQGSGRVPLPSPLPEPSDGDRRRVRTGQVVTGGDLDQVIVRRYLRRNLGRIQGCFVHGVAGTVVASFTIGGDGKVSVASASGVTREVATCVAQVIRGIGFPRPRGGASVQVRYPITFRAESR
jgi:hypothetical protein